MPGLLEKNVTPSEGRKPSDSFKNYGTDVILHLAHKANVTIHCKIDLGKSKGRG